MELLFLGTGTSTGIPQIGCDCETCRSHDSRDKRLRSSALLTLGNGVNILLDCGPDFYHQMLRTDSPHLEAVLLTHIHYDHVGGIDDLRPYCAEGDFPIYCSADVERDLRIRLPYCFATHLYPGVPHFLFHTLRPFEPVEIGGTEILPLPIMHAQLQILGFKIGKLAYITDCKFMPEDTINALTGIDTLVINALRHKEHLSHLSLSEALVLIKRIKPRRAYLTHLSHQMGRHEEVSKLLPDGVKVAYDGLKIFIT